MKNSLCLALGFFFVLLGLVGVFLPLLPTTPFILLAAYFFQKSSPRLHRWLLQHKLFGPLIRNWQEHRVITSKTKIVSLLTIAMVISIPLSLPKIPLWAKVSAFSLCLGVSLFIVTRKSQP